MRTCNFRQEERMLSNFSAPLKKKAKQREKKDKRNMSIQKKNMGVERKVT